MSPRPGVKLSFNPTRRVTPIASPSPSLTIGQPPIVGANCPMQKLRLRPKFKPRTRFTARYASYHMSSSHDSDIGRGLVADQFQHQEEKEDQDFAQVLLKLKFPNLYLESDQDSDSVSPQGLRTVPTQERDPLHSIFLIILRSLS